jgi:glycosyltransferase involved in cell wall biosynthesis
MPKFLQKAASIATVSSFSKADIMRQYGISESRIHVVYSAAKNSFRAVSTEEKEKIKKRYTDNREYFLYTGAIHPRKNLLNLLKAFSVFKKKLNSNLKLVIAGRLAWKYSVFVESLKTYKYRHDVIVTGYIPEEELTALTAAAYAMVYPSLWEGFGVPVLEAMRSGVPVITSKNSPMEEIAGEAALFADPERFHDIAEKMMQVYKDENLRQELIDKGHEIETAYTWDRTAALLWESMIAAVE